MNAHIRFLAASARLAPDLAAHARAALGWDVRARGLELTVSVPPHTLTSAQVERLLRRMQRRLVRGGEA